MEFIEIWSYVTVAVTLLMFTCGIPPCVNMYRTKSTDNVPFNMFLLGAVSGLGMLHYGLVLGNNILIFLNAVGTFFQVTYATLYVYVSKSKTQPLQYIGLAVLYEAILYGYLYQTFDDPLERANSLGFFSSLICTIMMLLPGVELIHNIRNKNADGMPRIMLFGGLACGSSWFLYGLMLKDMNIFMPNIPGISISLTKLYIIHLYGSDSKKKK